MLSVLAILGLYGGYLALLWATQSTMVYPGTHLRQRPGPQPVHEGREVVWLETSFGRVEAWYLPPVRDHLPAGPAPAVILAHGNNDLIDTMPGGFLGFRQRGFGLLLVEYPGYGSSDGTPSLESVTETFSAAYDSLVWRPDVDGDRVLALGQSLGGAAVCALASRRPLQALVLVAAFADLPSMAHRYLAPAFLVRDRYDNAAVLGSFPGPVLVVHGTRDGLIPHAHGERLAQAAPRGRLISYDSGHGDTPPDFGRFWQDLDAFLEQAGLRP